MKGQPIKTFKYRQGSSLVSNIFSICFILVLVGFTIYFFRNPVVVQNFIARINQTDCVLPLTYEVNNFDTKFGLSKSDFITAINTSAQKWNTALGVTALSAETGGRLKINLVFDERQAETSLLKDLNSKITNDRSGFDQLKAVYDTAKTDYQNKLANYKNALAAYERAGNDYEAQVQTWNAKGGAPKNVYNQLTQEKNNLKVQEVEANKLLSEVNLAVDYLNSVAQKVNAMAKTLNITVGQYNSVGLVGQEFEQGVFSVAGANRSITIYQFANQSKLIKVLTHEFGHALGLDHASSSQSVMYYLNQDKNQMILTADTAQILEKCRKSDSLDNFINEIRCIF